MQSTIDAPSPRTKRGGRDDEPVKVDRSVLRTARIVAAFRGKSLAEYLSEVLRPIVADHLAEEKRK